MIKRQEIVLDHDDLFQAVKRYVADNIDGIGENEVCQIHLSHTDTNKFGVRVIIRDEELKV